MLGRKPVTNGAVVAALLAVAVIGGCRDKATTGPSGVQGKDFAAHLNVVQGNQQTGPTAGALTQQLILKVVDAGGNPVQGAAVTFQVRTGGGSITPPAGTSNSSGLVSVTWTLGTSLGANSAIAYLTNNFVLDSALFTANATAGPPQLITIVSGNVQVNTVARVLPTPLVLNVKDQFGHNVSGAKVTWTPGANSGTVQVAVDTTAADGSASALWTLGTLATNQSVTASVVGLTPVVFTATAKADTVAFVALLTGGGQAGAVGSQLPTPITIKVTDPFGNAVANAPVNFVDSLAGGGTVTVRSANTAADGTASTLWTLGNRAGGQLLRVRQGSSAATVTLNVSATVAFSEVYVGNFMACGISATNQVAYCWGAGDAGQLGRGNLISTKVPTSAVSIGGDSVNGPFLQIRQITNGRNSFCALTVARQLFCWGRVAGQSAVVNSSATVQPIVDPRQQVLPAWVSTGEEHYCILDLSGLGFCTGTDFAGQLGDGSFTSPTVGTFPFIFDGSQHYSSIQSGRMHSCGFLRFGTSILPANNQVPQCWGLNLNGQVGNAAKTNQNKPVHVSLPVGAPTAFDSTSLALGDGHTCVLSSLPAAGAAWCWGSNGFGQLGKGTPIISTNSDSVMQAVAMPAGVTFVKLYAGEYHSCGISTAGAAYCWGRNDYGQLGDGTRTNQSAPVAVGGGLAFRSLSLGELFSCGVVAALGTPGQQSSSPGTIYCWGDNVFGQLGNGVAVNNAPALAPVRVSFQP